MPLQIRPEFFQLLALMLCVPVQYFLVSQFGNTEVGRSYALNQLTSNTFRSLGKFLTLDFWQNLLLSALAGMDDQIKQTPFYQALLFSDLKSSDSRGECPAVEVLLYRSPKGYYAGSPEPRTERPRHLLYRVGQVVEHRNRGYRGVIIGWDTEAKAPEEWLRSNYGNYWKRMREIPHYAVLVDSSPNQRLSAIVYVQQDQIRDVKVKHIFHPSLDQYFDSFDGAQYIARPWLKVVYPKD